MKPFREGGFLIAQIHQLSGRIFAGKLKEHRIDEINPAQGRILFALWKGDGVPIRDLAKRTQLKKSTLTSMLDRLERDGYITRSSSPNDRRVAMIFLTGKNEHLRDVHTLVSDEMIDLFYDGFSPDEVDKFEEYLRRILRNLMKEEQG